MSTSNRQGLFPVWKLAGVDKIKKASTLERLILSLQIYIANRLCRAGSPAYDSREGIGVS